MVATWESLFSETTKTNNNIFYHMFCINDAVKRFEKTYKKIIKSGLINNIDNIFVNCVGKNKNKYSSLIKNKPKITIKIGDHDKDESETLNLLRDFCINNNFGNILYMHSKGVTFPKNEYKNCWSECMQYFLIEQYDKCLSILKEYDTCGVHIQESLYWYNKDIFCQGRAYTPENQLKTKQQRASWYAGNFWWSKNLYISKLDKCGSYNRFDSELRFLLPSRSKFYNLYKPPQEFHLCKIYRHFYTQQPTLC